MVPRVVQQVGKPSPAYGDQRHERARIPKLFVLSPEQSPPQPEQCRATLGDALRLNLLFEERCPAVLEHCDLRPAYTARKQLLGDRAQARFGGHDALINLLEPLSPPGQLDCSQRWLRRSRNDIAHRRVDLEERRESRPQIRRKQPQHLRAIGTDRHGQFFVSGNRRPLQLRRHPRP